MITWMKKVNNFPIGKVQPWVLFCSCLIFFADFSLALLIKVLLIKKPWSCIQLDCNFNKHLPNIFLEAVLLLLCSAYVPTQVLFARPRPRWMGLHHDAATLP